MDVFIINIQVLLRNVKYFFFFFCEQTQSSSVVYLYIMNPAFICIQFKTNDLMQLVYLVHLTGLIDSQHRHQHLIVTKMGMIMRPPIKQHDDDDDDLIIHWTDLIAFLAAMNYMNPSTCCYSSLNRPIIFLQKQAHKKKYNENELKINIVWARVSKIRLDVINDLFNFL